MKRIIQMTIVAILFGVLNALPVFSSEQGLGRTWEKLETEKKLTIGYLGGSITCGTGASDAEKTSWRAKTTQWFREQFPGAEITEVNAGIGGTGSDWGAYRCEKQLLSKKPDLVFVEFAVNDFWFSRSHELESVEGIVRQIWKSNSKADIVFFYTTSKQIADTSYEKSTLPKAVLAQQEIADYYGIATVNGGQALWQAIQEKKGTWQTLTKDLTHPSDEGYAIYAETVRKFLELHRGDKPVSGVVLANPMSPDPLENAQMIDPWTLTVSGWNKEPVLTGAPFVHGLAASKPGLALDYTFTGTSIALYWVIAPDSGDIEYSVDEGAAKIISSWDQFALQFTRSNLCMLAEGLSRGSHTLHIKIAEKHAEKSTGTWIRIGAILIN